MESNNALHDLNKIALSNLAQLRHGSYTSLLSTKENVPLARKYQTSKADFCEEGSKAYKNSILHKIRLRDMIFCAPLLEEVKKY